MEKSKQSTELEFVGASPIKDSKKGPKFRMTGIRFFATYPQVNKINTKNPITCSDWLSAIRMKIPGFSHHLIAMEKHRDGSDHIHMILFFPKKKNFVSPKCFDVSIDNVKYHGRYEVIRKLQACINYCTKDGDYITDIVIDEGKNIQMGWSEIAHLASEGNTRRAEDLLRMCYPREYLCTNALNNIRNLSIVGEGPRYKIQDFDIPEPIWKWLAKETAPKTLYVYGKTGIGKTEAMVTFMEKYIGKTLIANTLDDLKMLKNGDFRGLILDDFDDEFIEMRRGTLIGIVDNERSRTIKARYHDIRVSSEVAKVILSNNSSFYVLGWDNAVQRRITEVEVTELRRLNKIEEKVENKVEEEIREETQDTPFSNSISNRTKGSLKRAGYRYMEDIKELSIQDISNIKGIAKKGTQSVVKAYEDFFRKPMKNNH